MSSAWWTILLRFIRFGIVGCSGMIVDFVKTVYDTAKETTKAYVGMEDTLNGLGMAVNLSVMAIAPAFGDLEAAEAAYRAEVEKGEQLQAERAL